MKRRCAVLVMGVLVGGALSGCGEKFTRVRYELVRDGMAQHRVEEILGTPTRVGADGWTYVHRLPFYQARIQFSDGRVSGKHWTLEKPSGPRRSRPGDDGWIEPDRSGPKEGEMEAPRRREATSQPARSAASL